MSPAIFHSPEVALVPRLLRWPFRQMVDHDVRMTIGTDYFLTPTPNLFPTLQAVVPQLSAEEILRAITIEGAKAVGREHELGSIQTGKLANFISVDRDLTQGSFEDAKVLETVYKDSGRSFNNRKIGAVTFALGLREFRAGIEYATPEISSASLKSPRIV